MIEQCINELDEYFKGKEKSLRSRCLRETAFQKCMGCTLYYSIRRKCLYLDIAQKVGNIKAVRAIGGANSRNPISIIVPCHRVIGKSGKLVGYAGGLWRKEWLLKHEGILK